jgi:hypothetical protein
MAKKTKSIKEVLDSPVKEVAPEITIEKLTPQYFNTEKLLHQPKPIYRIDLKDFRYYYNFGEDGEPKFYTSVTTLIKNTLPTPPALIKWMADKGAEDGKNEAMERACYGTCMHHLCGMLLINGKLDLGVVPNVLQQIALRENIQPQKGWVEELRKDALSFAQFMIERKVKPLAIEVCLYHPTDGYAGAIDLVAELDFDRKRITALIDLKSGRKNFYPSHEIQLGAYREMWKIHFPDKPVDKIFNWSPKDFRGKTPTYNLKDQTDSKNIAKLPYLVELSKIETEKRDDTVTVISGTIDLNKGLSDNISEKTFIELVCENK